MRCWAGALEDRARSLGAHNAQTGAITFVQRLGSAPDRGCSQPEKRSVHRVHVIMRCGPPTSVSLGRDTVVETTKVADLLDAARPGNDSTSRQSHRLGAAASSAHGSPGGVVCN